MKIRELVQSWKEESHSGNHHDFHFSVDDRTAARILALTEMYPGHSTNDILCDLVTAAIRELESSFPYVPGTNVVSRDEMGDPLYEDLGPTPKYLSLSKKHLESFRSKLN